MKSVCTTAHIPPSRGTNLRIQVTQVNMVAPTICGYSVWDLLHVTLLATRIVGWLLDFGKIMHQCPHLMVTFKITYHTYLNVYTPFPIFDKKVAMTCGSDPCITNKKMIIIIHQLNMSPCMFTELLYQNFNTYFAPLAWILVHFHNKSTLNRCLRIFFILYNDQPMHNYYK